MCVCARLLEGLQIYLQSLFFFKWKIWTKYSKRLRIDHYCGECMTFIILCNLMASLTGWMQVYVNSGSWWWTGRRGVLRFMGSQRVRHDWATEWIELKLTNTTVGGGRWRDWVGSRGGREKWKKKAKCRGTQSIQNGLRHHQVKSAAS